MARHDHRHTASPATRFAPLIAAVLTAAAVTSPVPAQSPEWRKVDNPYQEDVEYAIGAVYEPGVEANNVRWHSFKIETPEEGPFAAGEQVRVEVTVEVENRADKSEKILVILLLENEDGDPLDRIGVKPFKLASGRLKERKEVVRLPAEVIGSASRVYVLFEIMD